MKILMVLTSHDKLGNTGRKTGFWLEELAAPYFMFKDAGAEIVLASPKGGQPPLDPKSNEPSFQTDLTHRFEADAAANAQLASTVLLDSVKHEDYDTVFYPGGHGPMWDLVEDKNSIKLLESFLAAGKTFAVVCHSSGALRHVKTPDGKLFVEGKTVTGFTNGEEEEVGLTKVVPFLVDDELMSLGATIFLLHGYPSSSRMFDTLIPLLADRYHIVAPDYPGFGHSDAPPPSTFAYTFDHLAEIVGKLTEALALGNYALYLQDYGGPVGFRLALAHPERVKALVIQNAVAHEEGLGPAWEIRRAYWQDRDAYEAKVIPGFTSLSGAKERHIGSSPHPERYNPDTWADEFALLSRPGQAQIQADLFYDYQSNVASYPKWQAWMRQHKPPMLVVWGKFDPSFAVASADAYKRDVPDAEVHVLDAGHFALDVKVDEIAALMRSFLAKQHLGPS